MGSLSDTVLIQIMVSIVTLFTVLVGAIVQVIQMRNQNRVLSDTHSKLEVVETVVNGSHHEALRQIKQLEGEIRKLNISPTEFTPSVDDTPTGVTLAEGTGIVTATERP